MSVTGNGAACAGGQATAQSSARAVAEAIASGAIDATNGCAEVKAIVQARAFVDLFVSAAARAVAQACSTGGAACAGFVGAAWAGAAFVGCW